VPRHSKLRIVFCHGESPYGPPSPAARGQEGLLLGFVAGQL